MNTRGVLKQFQDDFFANILIRWNRSIIGTDQQTGYINYS